MVTINPYLNFAGNAEEAFTFYKSVFGKDIAFLQRFKDTPQAGNVSERDKEKIMHVSLPLGNGSTLMATDALESMGHKVKFGNNFHLSIEAENNDEARRLFSALSAGGKVTVPLADASWGAYFGMVTDKFGIQWMVSHTPKRQGT